MRISDWSSDVCSSDLPGSPKILSTISPKNQQASTNMQAATLPLRSGWQWIQDGFALFRRQPMAMFFWSLVTGFLLTISYLIPLLPQMVLFLVTPLLPFITLLACCHLVLVHPILLTMLPDPMKNNVARRLCLGLRVAF